MSLEWRIPFSTEEKDGPRVAHLIDTGQWLTRRLCLPQIVNSRLSEKPPAGTAHCTMCRHLERVGTQARDGRYPERRRARILKAAA